MKCFPRTLAQVVDFKRPPHRFDVLRPKQEQLRQIDQPEPGGAFLDQFHRVTGTHFTRLKHAQVQAEPPALGVTLGEPANTGTFFQRAAGDTRPGHTHHRTTDAERVADADLFVQPAADRQVFAEHAVR